MGIFDFFKKNRQNPKKKEKIKFEDIDKWIFSEKEIIKTEQQIPKKQIEYILKNLLEEIEQGLPALKKIDLSDRKEPERVKLIVLENLEKFIHLLERLIKDLKIISAESLEDLINKINLSFSNFDRQSSINFQKATFLIGKELEGIQQKVSGFFSEFNRIIKENEIFFKREKLVLEAEELLFRFKKEEKTKKEILTFMESLKMQINKSEKKIKEYNQEIDSLKKTEEYAKQSKNKQELDNLKKEFNNNITSLKESLDFKALTQVYHSIETQMNIIKEFKQNFKESLEKYGKEKFLDLFSIKEIDQKKIRESIKNIEQIREKINQINLNEDITEKIEKEADYLKKEINDKEREILENEKRIKKIDENKRLLKDKIMEKAEKG